MLWTPLFQLDKTLKSENKTFIFLIPTLSQVCPSIDQNLSIKYIVSQLRGWGFWSGLQGELRPVYKLLISFLYFLTFFSSPNHNKMSQSDYVMLKSQTDCDLRWLYSIILWCRCCIFFWYGNRHLSTAPQTHSSRFLCRSFDAKLSNIAWITGFHLDTPVARLHNQIQSKWFVCVFVLIKVWVAHILYKWHMDQSV